MNGYRCARSARASFENLEPRLLLDSTPPVILEVLPLPAEGGSTTAPIDGLTVQVSEDLEPLSVNSSANWEMRAAGADGLFDTTDDVLYGLVASPAYVSGTEIPLAIAPRPLQEGLYRFTAVSGGLEDLAGNDLDGDGDGTGGDDYVHTFTITTPTGTVIENTDNDVIAKATPLEMVEDPVGSGNFQGRGLGTINPVSGGGPWSDPDYWRFDALAGDHVAVSVDRLIGSGLNPYVELRNAADGVLASDNDGGPGNGAYISGYTIPTSGTYYVVVGHSWGASGGYHLRVDLARGMQMETDREYNNDSMGNADRLTLAYTGGHLKATVAGTIMAVQRWAQTDEDIFHWGQINAGCTVELVLTTPSSSTLLPKVSLLASDGTPVADTDPSETRFLGTVPANDVYYAKVESPHWWAHSGKIYEVTGSMHWQAAEDYAVSQGGHLVAINDAAEQAWIFHTLSPFDDLWIGLHDPAPDDNVWVWSSGEPVDYSNWADGRPRNWGGYDQAYLDGNNGRWYDSGETNRRAVAEWDDPSGPRELGAGPWAQYILDVDVEDPIPPQVTAVNGLPPQGSSADYLFRSFSVTFSEDLEASTVNQSNPFVAWHGGHAYLTTPSTMHWQAAEDYAVGLGGHLVAIDDAAEQAFLESWFAHYSPWIGINDMDFDDIWQWSSGQPVGYTNWAAGQPDNHWSQDAAYMDGFGRWNSRDENENRWGLVELAGAAAADGDSDGVPDVLDVYPNDPLDAWDLREAGPDHTFGTADDVIYDVQVVQQYSTGLTVQLRIMDGPLGNGQYRFSVNASIRDRADNQLDGDGDGTGGDPYVHEFTVALPPEYAFEGRSNNTYAQATALALTEDPPGSGYFISQRGLGRIDPVSGGGPWSDPDVWCFQALAGDIVSVAMDRTVGSGLNPQVYLYDANGTSLTNDNDGGPESNAFISHYQIPADGTYYVWAGHYWGGTGDYELRVDLARGIQQESDREYHNDSTANADTLTLSRQGNHRLATASDRFPVLRGDRGPTETPKADGQRRGGEPPPPARSSRQQDAVERQHVEDDLGEMRHQECHQATPPSPAWLLFFRAMGSSGRGE